MFRESQFEIWYRCELNNNLWITSAINGFIVFMLNSLHEVLSKQYRANSIPLMSIFLNTWRSFEISDVSIPISVKRDTCILHMCEYSWNVILKMLYVTFTAVPKRSDHSIEGDNNGPKHDVGMVLTCLNCRHQERRELGFGYSSYPNWEVFLEVRRMQYVVTLRQRTGEEFSNSVKGTRIMVCYSHP